MIICHEIGRRIFSKNLRPSVRQSTSSSVRFESRPAGRYFKLGRHNRQDLIVGEAHDYTFLLNFLQDDYLHFCPISPKIWRGSWFLGHFSSLPTGLDCSAQWLARKPFWTQSSRSFHAQGLFLCVCVCAFSKLGESPRQNRFMSFAFLHKSYTV